MTNHAMSSTERKIVILTEQIGRLTEGIGVPSEDGRVPRGDD